MDTILTMLLNYDENYKNEKSELPEATQGRLASSNEDQINDKKK